MRLVLVPTPIGNLEDITLRALRVLSEAEAVACEDTRRTGILLTHYGITTPRVHFDQHMSQQAPAIISRYQYLAYASDAGTPGISDPGAELVRAAITMGAEIEVLPGATALIPALVASGFPTARFEFEGFLPQKRSERLSRIRIMAQSGKTVLLYEAPHRLRETLTELAEIYGPGHPVSVAREISKLHEEHFRGSLAEAREHFTSPRGELVLVLAPREAPAAEPSALAAELRAQGLVGRELMTALVAAGVSRNQAYVLSHSDSLP